MVCVVGVVCQAQLVISILLLILVILVVSPLIVTTVTRPPRIVVIPPTRHRKLLYRPRIPSRRPPRLVPQLFQLTIISLHLVSKPLLSPKLLPLVVGFSV